MMGAFMFAFDQYFSGEVKENTRNAINSHLDERAETFAENRDNGNCGSRRRSGCSGGISALIVSLRDGIFLSRPFDPELALPETPEGWTAEPYTLAAIEGIVGQQVLEGSVARDSNETRLRKFHRASTTGSTSAARVYRNDDQVIAIAIEISKSGIRAAKKGDPLTMFVGRNPFMYLNGLFVEKHQQNNQDMRGNVEPVEFQFLTTHLEGQVEIFVLAMATDENIAALLEDIDIEMMLPELPITPSEYGSRPSELVVYDTQSTDG